MPSNRCRALTIFEGPDGSGKTTLALKYAAATGARYVHCGPYPLVKKGLGRLYVEAMLPALDGYEDVVMDRCWLSEPIYGDVHRGGQDRLGVVGRRMLDRVAMRCETRVVVCLPPVDTCLAAFRLRKGAELLRDEKALRVVHERYRRLTNYAILTHVYDYTLDAARDGVDWVRARVPTEAHLATIPSAGSRGEARVLLVGEAPGPVKEHDPLARYPFVSFSKQGCSWWLTEQLQAAKVPEQMLLWANASTLSEDFYHSVHPTTHVVALGEVTRQALPSYVKVDDVVEHPQHAKRFRFGKPYSLTKLIQGVLDHD